MCDVGAAEQVMTLVSARSRHLLDRHGALLVDIGRRQCSRGDAEAVAVAEEQHALAVAFGLVDRLDPLAPAGAAPKGADEAEGPALDVGAVVGAHDGPDGVRGLVGVVKGDGGDVVVQHVRLDDAVEELAADEAELAVNGGGGPTRKVPRLGLVVRERGIRVLEVGDGDWARLER